jgi:hypothetical protein
LSDLSAEQQLKLAQEEKQFYFRETKIYQAYLDSLYPGFFDHFSDGVGDAIQTLWKPERKTWENAREIADKWLKPTLERIRHDK